MSSLREKISKHAAAAAIKALGEEVTFTGDFGPYTAYMIFQPEYVGGDPYSGQFDRDNPIAQAVSEDVSGIRHKHTVQVGSVTYEVLQAHPDGYGVTELTLKKVRDDG